MIQIIMVSYFRTVSSLFQYELNVDKLWVNRMEMPGTDLSPAALLGEYICGEDRQQKVRNCLGQEILVS